MSFFSKPKSYLGVDLGAGGVKVVELRAEKNRPVLFTYGFTVGNHDVHQLLSKTVPSSPDEMIQANEFMRSPEAGKTAPSIVVDQSKITMYADMLRAVCKQAKTQSTMAVASLPVSAVFHAIVTMPFVKKEEFDRILRAEIKKLLPYPLEDMVLDSQVMPGEAGAKSQRVLVNAVPRAMVVFYTKVFQQAGLTLESLEPESIAITRSLVGRDASTTILVDMGAQRTNFFIVDQAVPITHHSIERGGAKMNAILESVLKLEPGAMTEQLKRDMFARLIANPTDSGITKEQFLELFNSIVEPVLKELEYSLDLFLRQSANQNKRPEKIILTGGSALFPFLADHIATKFKMRCYIGDPWGRVVYQESLKPILHAIGPRMSSAIGLALRNVIV